VLPSLQENEIGTSEFDPFRSSIPSLRSPLWTLRGWPRGQNLAHHSGPGRLARPYPVKDLHLLFFASLSWRTPSWVNRVGAKIVNVCSGRKAERYLCPKAL